MLTGEKPFSGDTITAITYKVVHTTPLPAQKLNPSLPADLDTIIGRCLSKSATERYASAADLITDLKALRLGRSLPSTQPTS
jgi:serine/threonine-protein kinase